MICHLTIELKGGSGVLSMSKAVNRTNKISIEDLEAALASHRASTTESKAVSVECPLLKPD